MASSFSGPTWAANQSRRGGHDFGVELLAVARHQDVAGFVDQAHGIELRRRGRRDRDGSATSRTWFMR